MTNCAQPLYVVRWLCWMVFIILCLCKFQSNPMECASNPDFSCLEWHLILLPLWLIDSITFFNSIYCIVRDSQMLHRLLKVQSEENPGLEVFRKVFTANTSENAESWVIHSDSEESSKRILNQVSKIRMMVAEIGMVLLAVGFSVLLSMKLKYEECKVLEDKGLSGCDFEIKWIYVMIPAWLMGIIYLKQLIERQQYYIKSAKLS